MGDFDFTLSRNKLVEAAIRKVGGLALGENPSAEQLLQGIEALNVVVKALQGANTFLWTETSGTVTILNEASSAILPATVLAIDHVYLIRSNAQPLEIPVVTHQTLPSAVTGSSTPQYAAVKPSVTPPILEIAIYPGASEELTLGWKGIQKAKDWDTAGGTGDFPEHFQLALVWALAADLSPEYGLSIAERNDLRAMAKTYLKEALSLCRERPTETYVRGSY